MSGDIVKREPPVEAWVVITERDCSIQDEIKWGHAAEGPLVAETYLSDRCTREAAIRCAKAMQPQYGRTWIARLLIERVP